MTGRIRDRRAISFLELVVAIALAAGPLLLAVNLVQSNVLAARFNRDRAVARMVLLDLSTLLQGESLPELRTGLTNARLTATLRQRMALLPEEGREAYLAQARPLLESLHGELEEEIDASRPGLARLSLSAKLPDRAVTQVASLFRPRARERLRLDVASDCASEGGPTGGQ